MGKGTFFSRIKDFLYRAGLFVKEGMSLHYLYLFAPLLLADLIFLYIVQKKHEFVVPDTVTLVFMFEKIVFDLLFISGVTLILMKLFRKKVFAVFFFTFYLFLQLLDAGLYNFANTLFEYHFLALIDWNAFKDLVGPVIIGLITALALMVLWTIFSLKRIENNGISWAIIVILLIPSTVIGLSRFPVGVDNFIHGDLEPRSLEANIRRELKNQLAYISQNSLINFIAEVTKRDVDYIITDDVSSLKKVIKKYKLPIGQRRYEDLGLKKYNKIILFATESLSLKFLKRYNEKLPVDLTPFYGSDEMTRYMFKNYRTSHSPTLQGLTVMFNSHPNFDLLLSGNYQNSLVKKLKNDGYETIFLRSSTKYFASENIHFKNFGYDKIIGSEDFAVIPGMEKYIYRWGVMDTFLYDKLFDMVKERKEGKYFITVLNVDTHPPYGRRKFKDISMPKLPENMKKLKRRARKYLKNIYYHDYYMKNFVQRLKDEGLFTDDTLLIFTADHACQPNSIMKQVPGYRRRTLAKVVLSFLTTQELPEITPNMTTSQIDFAPTVLHLLGKDIPQGYWGSSLFSKQKKPYYVGFRKKHLYLEWPGRRNSINVSSVKKKHRDIVDLYNTIVVD